MVWRLFLQFHKNDAWSLDLRFNHVSNSPVHSNTELDGQHLHERSHWMRQVKSQNYTFSILLLRGSVNLAHQTRTRKSTIACDQNKPQATVTRS